MQWSSLHLAATSSPNLSCSEGRSALFFLPQFNRPSSVINHHITFSQLVNQLYLQMGNIIVLIKKNQKSMRYLVVACLRSGVHLLRRGFPFPDERERGRPPSKLCLLFVVDTRICLKLTIFFKMQLHYPGCLEQKFQMQLSIS